MKQRLLKTSILIVLTTSLMLAACGSKPTKEENRMNQVSNDQGPTAELSYEKANINEDVVQAYNKFAMKLYAQIVQSEEMDNLFISPTSIATALSMALNGAQSDTLDAMLQTLELNGMTVDEINKSNEVLIDLLQHADSSVEMSIANSLWMKEDDKIHDEFIQTIEQSYQAHVETLDFSSPSAADSINSWVKEQSNEKIDKIVAHPIDADTLLFLINAIYFKGDWTHPFDEEDTIDTTFYSLDGTSTSVPMMNQNGDFEYLSTDDFEAIRLPYGEEEAWNMIVVLPNEEITLQELQPDLLSEPKSWTTGYETKNGDIHLPRFQMEVELKLKDTLSALGMDIAFDANLADFSAIGPTPPNIYIDKVMHKSFIDVNEEGTEAAAVTSIFIALQKGTIPKFEMIVDRPFFFAIEDRSTGAIMFMGNMVHF